MVVFCCFIEVRSPHGVLTQAVNNAFTAERCHFPGAGASCGLWWGFSGRWFCLSPRKEDVLCVKISFLH